MAKETKLVATNELHQRLINAGWEKRSEPATLGLLRDAMSLGGSSDQTEHAALAEAIAGLAESHMKGASARLEKVGFPLIAIGSTGDWLNICRVLGMEPSLDTGIWEIVDEARAFADRIRIEERIRWFEQRSLATVGKPQVSKKKDFAEWFLRNAVEQDPSLIFNELSDWVTLMKRNYPTDAPGKSTIADTDAWKEFQRKDIRAKVERQERLFQSR